MAVGVIQACGLESGLWFGQRLPIGVGNSSLGVRTAGQSVLEAF